jgi:hypothetical protein
MRSQLKAQHSPVAHNPQCHMKASSFDPSSFNASQAPLLYQPALNPEECARH